MLWRRETRRIDTAKTYKAVKEPGPNKVTVLELNKLLSPFNIYFLNNFQLHNRPSLK